MPQYSISVIYMSHPGKVVKVFSSRDGDVRSSDSSTQVLVEMWGENVFTFMVDSHISDIKDGEIVLVDYTPLSSTNPTPKHLVVKVLKGKTADATWNRYKKYHENRKTPAPS